MDRAWRRLLRRERPGRDVAHRARRRAGRRDPGSDPERIEADLIDRITSTTSGPDLVDERLAPRQADPVLGRHRAAHSDAAADRRGRVRQLGARGSSWSR
jgi:hypothetical protein